ncbi:MAG: rRNA adenine N-6-methyltransferase family protein [Trueperaceae bacterium]|nr:rRNA adenine N-6-methyltransferase family protein [Trueperaceae bacterium]
MVSTESAEQYFLSDVAQRRRLIDAAAIVPSDRVVELGAGNGSIAVMVPPCRSLTLVEYDPALAARLRDTVPHARVIEDDARQVLPKLRFDVLLSNLPHTLTGDVLARLRDRVRRGQTFRRALVAAHCSDDLANRDEVGGVFEVRFVGALKEDDFTPPQPFGSSLYLLTPLASLRTASER